jgi:hypothetical protein
MRMALTIFQSPVAAGLTQAKALAAMRMALLLSFNLYEILKSD